MKINNAAALVLLLTAAAYAAASASEAGGCTEEVTSFSACLPYVSNPPNNLTESPSEKCCSEFSSGVESLCLCHLLREPLILGFPLNTTKVLSLTSLCLSQTSTSLAFLCSVAPALPPLNSAPIQTTGTGISGSGGGGGSSGGGGGGGGGNEDAGGGGGGSFGEGPGPGSGSSSGSDQSRSFGRRVPIVPGNGGSDGRNDVHSSSNAPTLTLLNTVFLSILLTLLNT